MATKKTPVEVKKTPVKKVKTVKEPHIFIATPMYGGMCSGFYVQSLLPLEKLLAEHGIKSSFSFMFNESLIQRARNALASVFMRNDTYTHLMFIDADIKFNPNDLVHMVKADVDVICGIYPKKEINWQGVKNAVDNNVPVDQLKKYTGSLVVNLVNYSGEVTVPVNKPVQIWNGGTGFMLIKKTALTKMKKHVNSYVNDVLDTSGTIKQDIIHEFFPVMIEPETGRLLSEDYAFCYLCRKHGIKIWAAPWAQLGHMGSYLFEGGLLPAP